MADISQNYNIKFEGTFTGDQNSPPVFVSRGKFSIRIESLSGTSGTVGLYKAYNDKDTDANFLPENIDTSGTPASWVMGPSKASVQQDFEEVAGAWYKFKCTGFSGSGITYAIYQ